MQSSWGKISYSRRIFLSTAERRSIYPCRATVAEEEIKDAFTKNGFTVKAFKFFPKDRKMALIQMPNMDDAVAALIVSSFRN